jgi:peptide/nickel transport system permease protein
MNLTVCSPIGISSGADFSDRTLNHVQSLAAPAARWSIFVARRLGSAAVALLGVTILVFIVTHLLADPVYLLIGQRGTPAMIDSLRHSLGYDRPLWVQYFSYLGSLVHGDFGTSRYTFQPVAGEIAQRFPATLELAVAAMILGLLWTIPLGVFSAIRPGGIVDRISQGLVEFGVAIPSFWLGLLLVFFLYYMLKIAPAPIGQLDITIDAPPHITGLIVIDAIIAGNTTALGSALAHLFLPALTLSVTSCPPILQLTRNTMIQVLRSDFIRAARALGLPMRTVYWRYALQNTMLPVTTMAAMTFGYLLGGTVLVETVFSWPGIGLYAVQSMQRADYDPILGVVLLAATIYILVYLAADLAALFIDPRVRDAS